MIGTSRTRAMLRGILLVLVVVVQLLTLRTGAEWGDDWAMYVMQARNVAEGRAYGDTGYIVNPAQAEVGPVAYPPGFPLLLAPVYKLFGVRLDLFKLEVTLILLLVIGVVGLLFAAELPPAAAFVTWLFFAFNPYLANAKNTVTSDLPFLLFSSLVFLLARWVDQAWNPATTTPGRASSMRRWHWPVLLGLVIYAGLACRTVGAVWLMVLPAFDLIRFRRVRWPIVLAVGLVAVLAFAQALFLSTGETSYVNQFGGHFGYMATNVRAYGTSMMRFWSSQIALVDRGVMILLYVAAAMGFVKRLRTKVGLLDVFFVSYLGIVIVWPSEQAPRLLYPLLPAYAIYVAAGLLWLAERLGSGRRRPALVGVTTLLALVFGISFARADWGPIKGIQDGATQALFEFVRRETPRDAVIVFRKPRVLALYTNRRASIYHEAASPDALWDYFEKIEATYLVVNRNLPPDALGKEDVGFALYIQNFAATPGPRLRPVYENDTFRVFALDRSESVDEPITRRIGDSSPGAPLRKGHEPSAGEIQHQPERR